MKLQSICIILIIFFVQACATGTKRTLLKQTERDSIKSVELYNLVIQDEVKPAIEISNAAAMGGGLIAALVDSSINKGRSATSQDIIEPLYNKIDHLDYRKILAQEINTSMSSIYKLNSQKDSAENLLVGDPELKRKITELAEGEYLLYLSSFYGMMEDSRTLNVETLAMMFKKNTAKGKIDLSKPVYFNRLNYISESVGTGGSDAISTWSKDDGKLFINALTESAKEVAHQLKYDLQNTKMFECGKPVKVNGYGFNGVKLNINAVLIEQKPSRATVRASDSGALYSVAGTPIPASKNKASKCQ